MTATAPTVSIIVPVHNAAPYLGACIASVQAQGLADWELLLVDDGSSDGSARLMEDHARADPRITTLRQAHGGVVQARIRGLERARAPYVYLLDADDRCLPTALQRLHACLQAQPTAIAAHGPAAVIDAGGAETGRFGPVIRDTSPLDIFPHVIEREFMLIGTTLFRRQAIGPEDLETALTVCEDWLMWCRIAAKGAFVRLDGAPVMQYRRHGRNTSSASLHESLRHALAGLEAIHADPAIRRRMTPDQAALHHNAGLFYACFDRLKQAFRQRDHHAALVFAGCALRHAWRDAETFRHLAGRLFGHLVR